ncbi:hypothetical protein PVAG01_06018 [Phlyctema vagabunda]|uniref:Post-SET domain-containing protein n=1 Tax=Phlyctema vagabunda TaxID=108571 RepID=A0ABR4PEV3_9HELO
MAPLTPHWTQPSHPDIQEVLASKTTDFTTKSISRVDRAPFAVFAKLAFPPCTEAPEGATYATVQMGRDAHLNLNSDLVYINHSCDPSLIFDMSSLNIIVGAGGLRRGDELTFFYPSTEWAMAQGFHCFCGTARCRGYIAGAGSMAAAQLEGYWLNAHIRGLLEEKAAKETKEGNAQPAAAPQQQQQHDPVRLALVDSLDRARDTVDAAQKALDVYVRVHEATTTTTTGDSAKGRNGVGSREMSGEMGGDTTTATAA